MKKRYTMIAIITFMVSVGIVEDAYQEMTGRDSSLMPQVSRIDASYITVSGFGEVAYVNTADLFASVYKIDYQTRMYAKSLMRQVTTALGLTEEEEPIREAYGLEIL